MGRCNEYSRSVKLVGRGGAWGEIYFDFVTITFSGMVLLLGAG